MPSLAKRLPPIAAVALLLGCGNTSSPTGPAPVSFGLAQTAEWSIRLQVTSCSDSNYSCRVGGLENLTLRIAADGVSGLALIAPFEGSQPFAVDLKGALQTDGRWAASGTLRVPGRGTRVDAQLALTGADTPAISGTVSYRIDHGVGPQTRSARVLSSRALDTARAGLFEGRWAGYVERTSCTGTCDDDPMFGYIVDFEMRMTQWASSIEGTLDRFGLFNVTPNGASLTLSASHGTANDPGCLPHYYGRTCFVEIKDLRVTIDKLDRMHGTLSYRRQGYTDTGSPYSSVSGTARLIGVARWD